MAQFFQQDFEFAETFTASPSQQSFAKHMHNGYELYYFLQGNADYIIGDSVYALQDNALLLIRPSVFHYLKLRTSDPYRRIVLHFTQKHVPETLHADLSRLPAHYRIPPSHTIHRLFTDAVSIAERYDRQDAYEGLLDCLALIVRELKYGNELHDNEQTLLHPLLSKMLRFIDGNLQVPLNVSVLAETFYISRSWISHAFQDYLGTSVQQYIIRKKMLSAQQYIESGVPPMETAALLGFTNYSTFFKQYKKQLGMKPIEAKRNA